MLLLRRELKPRLNLRSRRRLPVIGVYLETDFDLRNRLEFLLYYAVPITCIV